MQIQILGDGLVDVGAIIEIRRAEASVGRIDRMEGIDIHRILGRRATEIPTPAQQILALDSGCQVDVVFPDSLVRREAIGIDREHILQPRRLTEVLGR